MRRAAIFLGLTFFGNWSFAGLFFVLAAAGARPSGRHLARPTCSSR